MDVYNIQQNIKKFIVTLTRYSIIYLGTYSKVQARNLAKYYTGAANVLQHSISKYNINYNTAI